MSFELLSEPDKGTSKSKNVFLENDSLFVTVKSLTRHEFNVYMLSSIGMQKSYRPIFDLLRNTKSQDKVNLFMNNHGGSVTTGIDIINAIRNCKSTVRTIVTGPLYSMAPLIALQGESIKVESNSFLMFHDYSTMEGGKGSEIEASVKHFRQFFKDCLEDWCKGFLSKKEIREILVGKDLYIGNGEIKSRLRKMGKLGE